MKIRPPRGARAGCRRLAVLAAWAAMSGCSIYDGTTPAGAGSADVGDALLPKDVEGAEASGPADVLAPESDAEISGDADGAGDRIAQVDASGDPSTDADGTGIDSIRDSDGAGGDRIIDVDAAETGGDANDVRGEVMADAVGEGPVEAGARDAPAETAGSDVEGGRDGPADLLDDRPPTTGFRVQYKAVNTQASANAIQSELTILDAGPSTVPLEEISVRYYFTAEVIEPWAIDIGFTGLNPGFTDLAQFAIKNVVRMATPTPTADTYVELGYRAGAPSIGTGQSVIIAWQFHSDNFAVLDQTNDYSFDASKTNAADWDRVVLVRSGVAIWGLAP